MLRLNHVKLFLFLFENFLIIFFEINLKNIVKPSITNVVSLDEKTVKVYWTFNSTISPTKFKIVVSDFRGANAAEWPSQLRRVNYDLTDEPYKTTFSMSNMDCFSQCLNDRPCKFAIRSSKVADGANCQLKNVTASTANGTTTNIDADSEYVELSAYSTEATLTNVGVNMAYAFQVAVYDDFTNLWTNYSASSYLDRSIRA